MNTKTHFKNNKNYDTITTNPQQNTNTLYNKTITTNPQQTILTILIYQTKNSSSFTITTASNLFAVPLRQLTQTKNTHVIQDDTSSLSTLNTKTTQQNPTQQILTRTHDPPPLPSECSTNTTPKHSLNKVLQLHI